MTALQVPVAVPPNLDPAIAKQVIEYLKANPEAAQQSYEQAHRMLQTPGMAQMMLDAKVAPVAEHAGTPMHASCMHGLPCCQPRSLGACAEDAVIQQPGAHGQDDAAQGRSRAEAGV